MQHVITERARAVLVVKDELSGYLGDPVILPKLDAIVAKIASGSGSPTHSVPQERKRQ